MKLKTYYVLGTPTKDSALMEKTAGALKARIREFIEQSIEYTFKTQVAKKWNLLPNGTFAEVLKHGESEVWDVEVTVKLKRK